MAIFSISTIFGLTPRSFNFNVFICFVLLIQAEKTSGRSFPASDYMEHNHEQHGESTLGHGRCGEVLFASLIAQTISIPRPDDPGTGIYCEWTIKARSPHLKIGIATVNQFLDFFQNNSLCIDIYDGPSADSDKLSFWYGRENFHPRHFDALTSTADVLFINYTARGGPIDLHMDLIYYLCGGRTDSELKIGSPKFNQNTTFEVPDLLECTWILERPNDDVYGLLQFYAIKVPDCWTLTVRTSNGGLVSVYNTDKFDRDKTQFVTSQNTTLDEFALARKEFQEIILSETGLNDRESTDTKLESNETFYHSFDEDYETGTIQEIQICNSSIQGIMFNGSEMALTFTMFYPEKKYGFRALFQILKLPHTKSEKKNSVRNWFINYGALVFCSVGILVGCIIMYCQARKWSRRGKRRKYLNGNIPPRNTAVSRNTRTNLYSNYDNGPLVKLHSYAQTQQPLVELREMGSSYSDLDDEANLVVKPFHSCDLAWEYCQETSPGTHEVDSEPAHNKNYCQKPLKRSASDSELLVDPFKKVTLDVG